MLRLHLFPTPIFPHPDCATSGKNEKKIGFEIDEIFALKNVFFLGNADCCDCIYEKDVTASCIKTSD